MSWRHDFELTVNLKEEVPDEILDMLTFLLGHGQQPSIVPDDPFFKGDWARGRFAEWVMEDNPHAGVAVCSFRRVFRFTQNGIDHHRYTLHLRFGGTSRTVFESGIPFAMWLAKWSDQNECVGYFKSELLSHPTLIYFHDNELYLSEVSQFPRRATDGKIWSRSR
jgi:hypothetical protein